MDSGESVCVSNNGRADSDSVMDDTLHASVDVESRVAVGDGRVMDSVGREIVDVRVTVNRGDSVGVNDGVLIFGLERVVGDDWVSEWAV